MNRVVAPLTVLIICGAATGCAAKRRVRFPQTPQTRAFIATAHSQRGLAASGELSRKGTVAADPKVLPLGSLILVTGAGKYSGKYKVIDTGPRVKGRRIDIYMDSLREARRFGRRRVGVKVLQAGGETQHAAASP